MGFGRKHKRLIRRQKRRNKKERARANREGLHGGRRQINIPDFFTKTPQPLYKNFYGIDICVGIESIGGFSEKTAPSLAQRLGEESQYSRDSGVEQHVYSEIIDSFVHIDSQGRLRLPLVQADSTYSKPYYTRCVHSSMIVDFKGSSY